uniref:Uncharacterized protein n=1 Tax=Rhipicephalus appendiculatus TaxID=34631 RepID=A0A131YCP6_RHIAP
MAKVSSCRIVAVMATLALLLSTMPAGTLCENPEAMRGLIMLLASKIKPVTHVKPAVIKTKILNVAKKPATSEVVSGISDVALGICDFLGC